MASKPVCKYCTHCGTSSLPVQDDDVVTIPTTHTAEESFQEGMALFLATNEYESDENDIDDDSDFDDDAKATEDCARAVALFEKAAAMGHPEAMYFLGECYSDGLGVEQDDERARELLLKSADLGCSSALLALSRSTDDPDEALHYLSRAATKRDVRAQYALGQFYSHRATPDHREAARYYQLASAQGHASAMFNLALTYANGQGVPRNEGHAAALFRQAGEHGHPGALNNRALCLLNGIGVEQDQEEAVALFRTAARKGHTRAQFNLSRCHVRGIGTRQDIRAAWYWAKLAAENGHVSARRLYEQLQPMLRDTPPPVKPLLRRRRHKTDAHRYRELLKPLTRRDEQSVPRPNPSAAIYDEYITNQGSGVIPCSPPRQDHPQHSHHHSSDHNERQGRRVNVQVLRGLNTRVLSQVPTQLSPTRASPSSPWLSGNFADFPK